MVGYRHREEHKVYLANGAAPQGNIVMIVFESLADAEKWYSTSPCNELIPERQKAAKTQLCIVEGLPQ